MKNRNVVEIYYFTFSTAIHFNTHTQPPALKYQRTHFFICGISDFVKEFVIWCFVYVP